MRLLVGAGVHVNRSYPAGWSKAPHAIHSYRRQRKGTKQLQKTRTGTKTVTRAISFS